jgi:hypothetical protein
MLRWTAKVSSKCVRGYEEGVVPVNLRKTETVLETFRDQNSHKTVLLHASV